MTLWNLEPQDQNSYMGILYLTDRRNLETPIFSGKRDIGVLTPGSTPHNDTHPTGNHVIPIMKPRSQWHPMTRPKNQWPSGTLVFHSFVAPRCHQHCHHTDHALAHGDPDHGGGYGHHPLHEIPETNLNWKGQIFTVSWRNFSWKSSEYSKLTKWMAQLLFVAFFYDPWLWAKLQTPINIGKWSLHQGPYYILFDS